MLTDKKLFLLDLDGTVYLDRAVFPKVPEFLRAVRASGGRYVFLTNNSSRGVESYVEHLCSLGLPAAAEDFVTSAQATVRYLKKRGVTGKIYCLGTSSFARELTDAGFSLAASADEEVTALVSGFDRELTFKKLEDACILLGRGVDYIATNPDMVCPTAWGYVPDCGSVSDMLFNATGRRPVFIGKPQPEMVYMAMELSGFSKEQTLVVGDRLYTDIASGVNAGVDTALVLSGESTLKTLEESEVKPAFVFGGIEDIYKEIFLRS